MKNGGCQGELRVLKWVERKKQTGVGECFKYFTRSLIIGRDFSTFLL